MQIFIRMLFTESSQIQAVQNMMGLQGSIPVFFTIHLVHYPYPCEDKGIKKILLFRIMRFTRIELIVELELSLANGIS